MVGLLGDPPRLPASAARIGSTLLFYAIEKCRPLRSPYVGLSRSTPSPEKLSEVEPLLSSASGRPLHGLAMKASTPLLLDWFRPSDKPSRSVESRSPPQAATKGSGGGKLPAGKGALRSPDRSFAAASW
jgi:hypothetical protein